MSLTGKVAIVTGAGRGIGRAIALAMAKAGAAVVVNDVGASVAGTGGDEGPGAETVNAISEAGGRAVLNTDSVAEWESAQRIVARATEAFGRLDIVVGNAGLLGRLGPLTHLPEKDWIDLWAVNVTANWHLMRTTEPLLRASDAGRAVFVSSGAAIKHRPYWGPYGASKAALDHLVKTWAAELAITPVKANAFNPGPVATRMRAAAMPGEDPATIPQPADVAPAIVALCRPEETRSGEVVSFG